MQKETKIESLDRQIGTSGSFVPKVERTEWVPGPCSNAPIRSTWRDAIGKPLTNRSIARYQNEGKLGGTPKQRSEPKSFVVFRCACGVKEEVRFLTYKYLPNSGYYCPRCLAQYRRQKELEQQLASRVRGVRDITEYE